VDFSWTPEQQTYHASVVQFAERELNDDVVARDDHHEFSPEAWKKCAAFGIQGLPIPEEYGGGGADPLTVALAMEGLGYGCHDNGLIFSLNAQMWSCEMPILIFGSADQKRRYLPGLCDGSLVGVQAMTEPGSGSDAFGLTTSAVPQGEHFVLNGTKTFVTNAPIADLFVVFAATDSGKGLAGISAFVVDRQTPGVTVGKPFKKMGLHTSPMSEVLLTDCRVSADDVLGKPGNGAMVFNTSMDWERSLILASALGTMQRQLDVSVAYARERKQFGQPIGKNQAVAHKLVEMKLRLKTARLLIYEVAWLKSKGKATMAESALAKLYLSQNFLASSLDALSIHGGYGYMVELGLERDVRDAVASQIYSGTSDIQRNIAAAWMRL
jgi:alkylation response protein AidB-like acyl-CoA dehydrogenase